MDASQTTLQFSGFLPNWGPGTRAEIGSETLLVTSVDDDTNTATVVRGWLNSTKTSHAASAPILVNPRFYRVDVFSLINECLDDLFGKDLYRVSETNFVYSGGLIGYEIPTEAIEVLRVDAEKDSSAKYWDIISDWLEMDNAPTNDFPSGRAIMIRASLPFGARIRVIYALPFTKLTTESQDLQGTGGLRPYMEDLPFYYAMHRLLADDERHRSNVEAAENHQRAQDTPAFLALRTGQWYQARYEERIKIARAHLLKEYRKAKITSYGS